MRHQGYPYVGQLIEGQDHFLVLFVRPDTGVVVWPHEEIGDISDTWPEEMFNAVPWRTAKYSLAYALRVGYDEAEGRARLELS